MATTKNRWFSDAVGTARDFFRVGLSGVRLKNVAGVLQLRNSADSADAGIKVSALQMPTGAGVNKVATSDASGNMSWQDGANPVSSSYPEMFAVFGDEMNYAGALPAVWNATALRYGGGLWVPNTNLAEAVKAVKVRGGTWQINVLTAKNTTYGILRVSVDGNVLGSTDLYAAALVADFLITYNGVTVTGDGDCSLNFLVNGKNAAATQYGLFVNKVWGYRTGP